MFRKTITQNLNWIENDPDSNPVLNETTNVTYVFCGINVYEQNMYIVHSGKYSLNGEKPKSSAPEIRGFK